MTKNELYTIAPNADLVTENELHDAWHALVKMWDYYNKKYVFDGGKFKENTPVEVLKIMDTLNTACIACHALQNIKEVVDHA